MREPLDAVASLTDPRCSPMRRIMLLIEFGSEMRALGLELVLSRVLLGVGLLLMLLNEGDLHTFEIECHVLAAFLRDAQDPPTDQPVVR